MFRRRTVSRSQTRTRNGSRPVVSRAARHNMAALVFFLCVLLVLFVILVAARISLEQAILLGFALLALVVCLTGIWLVGRKRIQGVKKGVSGDWKRVSPAPVFARPLTIADLVRLSPGDFEDFVGDLLEATGQCTAIRRIGGAGDKGADLLAKDRFGRPFIVQCKRYHLGHKVSAGEMRNFLGAKSIYGADECLFVTTSTFTEAARDNMARFRHIVFLWDGEKLAQLVQEHWDNLPSRWKARREGEKS
jgi:Restriction endonuclease